ncbi:MAG: hypothetical protein JRG94_15490 [Deltaproteobacteria bacterium]|nr:hypothetical protein [Deltaproteobacteria bacterium]
MRHSGGTAISLAAMALSPSSALRPRRLPMPARQVLFGVGQQQSALDLGAQDLVLCGEELVAEHDLLIDGAGDVGEHLAPGHGAA